MAPEDGTGACPQGIVFFLIIRPDQEKAIKKILSALRGFAVQKLECAIDEGRYKTNGKQPGEMTAFSAR